MWIHMPSATGGYPSFFMVSHDVPRSRWGHPLTPEVLARKALRPAHRWHARAKALPRTPCPKPCQE